MDKNYGLPYRDRRRMYLKMKTESVTMEYKDIENVLLGTEEDLTLTTNDVADILSYSLEHVQNNIVNDLDSVWLANVDKELAYKIRMYTGNPRLKKCISKKSVERFVTNNLSVVGRREVVEIDKKSLLIAEIKEMLGKRPKIQSMLDDLGIYLDEKYNAKELFNKRKDRIEQLKQAALNNKKDFNLLHYIETESLDVAEIVEYYTSVENSMNESNIKELFDILTFDMYSVKDLKKRLGKKYTKQIYRFLENVNYIAIKINDDEYDREEAKISDRNIRYIITSEDFRVTKGVYKLSLDYYVYEKLKSIAEITPGFLSVEDILNKEIIDFAEANKDKYIKKEKED